MTVKEVQDLIEGNGWFQPVVLLLVVALAAHVFNLARRLLMPLLKSEDIARAWVLYGEHIKSNKLPRLAGEIIVLGIFSGILQQLLSLVFPWRDVVLFFTFSVLFSLVNIIISSRYWRDLPQRGYPQSYVARGYVSDIIGGTIFAGCLAVLGGLGI